MSLFFFFRNLADFVFPPITATAAKMLKSKQRAFYFTSKKRQSEFKSKQRSFIFYSRGGA